MTEKYMAFNSILIFYCSSHFHCHRTRRTCLCMFAKQIPRWYLYNIETDNQSLMLSRLKSNSGSTLYKASAVDILATVLRASISGTEGSKDWSICFNFSGQERTCNQVYGGLSVRLLERSMLRFKFRAQSVSALQKPFLLRELQYCTVVVLHTCRNGNRQWHKG